MCGLNYHLASRAAPSAMNKLYHLVKLLMPHSLIRQRFVIAALIVSLPLIAWPQTKSKLRAKVPHVTLNNELAKSLDELLQARPLLPESKTEAEAITPNNDASDDDKPPADDAPLKALLDYWRNRTAEEEWEAKPTARVAERLLAAAENRPWLFPSLLAVLPDESATHDRIHRVWAAASREDDVAWRKEVAEWLKRHSRYLREEFIQDVRAQMREGASQQNFELVKDLARLDWEAAQPMLATAPPEMRNLIVYEHAVKHGGSEDQKALRPALQALLTQSTDSGWKAWALQTLMTSEWAGRDEWFASLFADPRLTGVRVEIEQEKKATPDDGKDETPAEKFLNTEQIESHLLFFPLLKNPKELAPIVLRLVGDKNRLVHEGAVFTLAEWLSEIRGKKWNDALPIIHDVARALTPWLTNASWANKDSRPSYVYSLQFLKLPEALDGLGWILENDEDDTLRSVAAECLTAYRNPVAAPALRRALERTTDEAEREKYITALYECGGFTDDEIAVALEAFARKLIAVGGVDEIIRAQNGANADPLPLPVAIGHVVHESPTLAATEGMTLKLFERIRQLRRTNLPLAKQLLEIIQNVPLPVADQLFAERIGEGWIDAVGVMVALARRDTMKKHAADSLLRLAYGNGAAAGVAVALLDNEDRAKDLLKGSDQLAQKALLACMRYLRDGLPIDLVAPLLKDAALEKYAESYLIVEDSRASRELVWARHSKEAMILGATFEETVLYDGNAPVFGFIPREKALQSELKAPKAPNVIYAVIAGGNEPQHIEVRAWRDRAELRVYLDPSHWRARRLSANEFAGLQTLTARPEIEDLGPASWRAKEIEGFFEYLRISADGGRRIVLSGLHPTPAQDATLHETLAGFFLQLSRTGEFKISFALEDKFPTLSVLPADDVYAPVAICQEGGQMRVAVTEKNTKEDLHINPEWRALTKDGIGGIVTVSPACEMTMPTGWQRPDAPGKADSIPLDSINERRLYLNLSGAGLPIDAAQLSATAALLEKFDVPYLHALASPDQQWLVMVTLTKDETFQLMRINTQTKKKYPVGAASKTLTTPFRWLPIQQKMLLGELHSFERKADMTMSLLDVTTGALQTLQAEFRPLLDGREWRAFQATGKPHEFWAAIYEAEKELTRFGRYDAQAFKFTSLIELPNMRVGSSALWMDETKNELWLVYEGLLLRIPLATKTK